MQFKVCERLQASELFKSRVTNFGGGQIQNLKLTHVDQMLNAVIRDS